jgi:hypothetical protein
MAAPDFTPGPLHEPTMVRTVRGPENITSTRTKIEMHDEMFWVLPEASPLLTALNRIKKSKIVENQKYEHLIMEEMPRSAILTADSAAGDTSINVGLTEVLRFIPFMLVRHVKSDEVAHITVVTTATGVLTVTRAKNGISADWALGDVIQVIGTAYEDGSEKGTVLTAQEVADYNYTQIFKRDYGWTYRDKVTAAYGGKDPVTSKQQVAIEFRLDLEYAAYFGPRSVTTSVVTTGRYTTTTGGATQFLKTNVWDLGNTRPTKRQFIRFMKDAMKYGLGGWLQGPGKKYMFCGSNWLTWITEEYEDLIRLENFEDSIGFKVNSLLTPNGTLFFVRAPALDRNDGNDAFIFDLNHIRKVTLKGQDIEDRKNMQNPSALTEEGEFYTDCGWMFDMEIPHARIRNLALGA